MVERRLFFSQEITPEVVEFVRGDPEISQGVREGSILYVTKIPYMTKEYLAETDPQMKRYYACHCPWARKLLQAGEKTVSARFCQCSAGFHKKSWEVIFGQPLHADVLESLCKATCAAGLLSTCPRRSPNEQHRPRTAWRGIV